MADDEAALASIVSAEPSSMPVSLEPLPHARMLWFDGQAATDETSASAHASDRKSEEASLLLAASYSIVPSHAGATQGWADRYGGGGIGANGGSGRAVVVNGLSVKGVGPTPLIGKGASPSHSGGGAYLEEALREAIFSRFFRKVLPHGAIPVSAIIDTGAEQTWHFRDGTAETQRRVLIVRPFPLRPAHFQRAYLYRPRTLNETRLDAQRVRHNFSAASRLFGREGLRDRLHRCYVRWSEQIAFAHVTGLALGATASNIDIEGRILDFGASSILPGTANFVISPSVTSLCDEAKLLQSLQSLARMAAEFDAELYGAFHGEVERATRDAYRATVVRQALGAAGLGRQAGSVAPDSRLHEQIYRDYAHYARTANRLRVDLLPVHFEVEADDLRRGGLKRIWSSDRPSSLDPLARTLKSNFPIPPLNAGHEEEGGPPVTRETLRSEIQSMISTAKATRRYEEDVSALLDRLHSWF